MAASLKAAIATFLPPKRPLVLTPVPAKPQLLEKPVKPIYPVNRFHQFSVPLEEVKLNYKKPIPPVMRQALFYIANEPNAAKAEYIFKRTPPQSRLLIMRELANKGFRVHFNNPYEAAALIKLFLREMPAPLIPSSEYESIIAFAHIAKEGLRIKHAVDIIDHIPAEHKALLWRVFKLWGAVSKLKKHNRMGSWELASMVGTCICWSADPVHMTTDHIRALGEFTWFLIEHAHRFFRFDPAKVPDGGWHTAMVNRTPDAGSATSLAEDERSLSRDGRSEQEEQTIGTTVYYNVLRNGRSLFVAEKNLN